MAKPRMDLSAFVGKLLEEQDGDVLREGIRMLSQALMETEVAGLIGADRHERTPDRTGHRNGYRMRTWDTRVGTIELAIPKVRPGTYFPSLSSPAGAQSTRSWLSCRKRTCTASRRGRWTS
jgi:putative transposase